MKKTDKKVKDYLERARIIMELTKDNKEWTWWQLAQQIEIAKMIQKEEK